jgi:FdhD protein
MPVPPMTCARSAGRPAALGYNRESIHAAESGVSDSSLAIEIDRVRNGSTATLHDEIAVEEPLELQICTSGPSGAAARSVSITMRTPGSDAELALGFLYGESVITAIDDVASVDTVGKADPETGLRNTVRVQLRRHVEPDLDRLQRHFYTTSSCGVCGKASLDAVRVAAPDVAAGTFVIDRDTLTSLPGRLRAEQELFDSTGGLHAAAAFDAGGRLLVVREDVGRHNAVDKVVGALLTERRIPATDLGLLVSGRASFELTQKAIVAGMPMLAAVGAPSSLAVRLAREFGISLIGFLRDRNFNIYAGKERIKQ